jgi:hypothetical protein
LLESKQKLDFENIVKKSPNLFEIESQFCTKINNSTDLFLDVDVEICPSDLSQSINFDRCLGPADQDESGHRWVRVQLVISTIAFFQRNCFQNFIYLLFQIQ